MTPGLPLGLTPGLPLGLTLGLPFALAPGLPFGLTPRLPFGSHPCNSLCFGREPKARVATLMSPCLPMVHLWTKGVPATH